MHNNLCNNYKFQRSCNARDSGRNNKCNRAEENVPSTSDRIPSRANSNCDVERTRACVRNQVTPAERSCSVPPRPCTRRNLHLLPQHFVTPGNPYPKFNDKSNTKKIPIKNESTTNRPCKQSQARNTTTASYQKQSFSSDARKKCSTNRSSNSEYSKSPKGSSIKDKHDICQKQCCCLNKPETRRTPIPTPRIIKISSADRPTMAQDYEYLQFSLRITEDIIRNDLYNSREMRRVFNSHIEANKGRLDMNKMLLQIDHLCKELNLSERNTNQLTNECTCHAPKIEVSSPSSSQNSLQNILKKIIDGQYLISDDEVHKLTENDLEEVITEILNNATEENDPNISKEMVQNENEDENQSIENVDVIHSNVDNFQRSLSDERFKEVSSKPSDETGINKGDNEIVNDEIIVENKIDEQELVKQNLSYLNSYEAIKTMLYDALNKMTQSKCKGCKSFNSNTELLKSILQDIITNLSSQENCTGEGKEIHSVSSKDNKLIEQKSVEEILNIIQNVSQLCCNANHEMEQNIVETEPNVSSEQCEPAAPLKNKSFDYHFTNLENGTLKPPKVKCACVDKCTEKPEVSIVEPKTSVVNPENKPVTFTDQIVQTSFLEDDNDMLTCDFNKNCEKDKHCCSAVKDVACECGEQFINTKVPLEIINESVYEVDNKINKVERKDREEYISSITNYILERTFNSIDTQKPTFQDAQVQSEIQEIEDKIEPVKSEKDVSCTSICTNETPCAPEVESEIPIKNTLEINKYQNDFAGKCEDECTYKQNKQLNNNKSEFVSKLEGTICASNKVEVESEIPIKNTLDINKYQNDFAGKCEDECTYKQNKQINNNKSEFVSKIEGIICASNKNLYQFTEPRENTHVMIPLCLKTLDKYETEYSKSYNKPPKKYKCEKPKSIISKSDETSSEGEVSRSSVDSGCCKQVSHRVIKRDQPEILERLKKYERNIKKSNQLNPCLCDYEIQNCEDDSCYQFYTPKFSRSKFFPTISTQTSNTNLHSSSGYHDNLLSDGEIQNTSSECTTDTCGHNM